MFLGTLGISAIALLALIVAAPARFGLARVHVDAEGSGPGASAATDPSGHGATAAPGGVAVKAPVAGGGSGIGYVDPRWPAGQRLPSEFIGSGYGQDDRLWSAADRPFVPRPVSELADPRDPRPVVQREPVQPTLPERIFADARPSVVLVTALSEADRKYKRVRVIAGTGSGLVWDNEGHIVTSRHVLDNVVGANVTLSDGSRWAATLINVDMESDVAVLQIEPRGSALTPIRVGTSSDLVVGMAAFTVSSPYALQDSLTSGLISGLNRNIQTSTGLQIGGMVQTDAPLHPGSSGGALIDDQGRVIGMNTAVHLESGIVSGVGFAIPIDSLQEIVPRLIRTGMHWHHEYGFLTLSAERTQDKLRENAEYAKRLNRRGASPLSGAAESGLPTRGLMVTGVDADSGAAQAGLRPGVWLQGSEGVDRIVPRDVVLGASGSPVMSGTELKRAIEQLDPGEPLRLDVWRNGIELTLLLDRTATLRLPVRSEGR